MAHRPVTCRRPASSTNHGGLAKGAATLVVAAWLGVGCTAAAPAGSDPMPVDRPLVAPAASAGNPAPAGATLVRSISITDFKAVGDGATDNQDTIQAAFDYAEAHGLAVFVPAGVFAHSGTLAAQGIRVFGTGRQSVLHGTDPAHEALYLRGTGASVSDVSFTAEPSGRISSTDSTQICADQASNFAIRAVVIDGSASGGIMAYGADHGEIVGNTVTGTNADAIHMTNGAHDIVVRGNRIERAGDDSIAVVTYGPDSSPGHAILIEGNTILDQRSGRGITVAGGQDVVIRGNHIEGGKADRAGVYVAAEPAYHTAGNQAVTIDGNTLKDAGGAESGHGAIMVWNGEGDAATNRDITITNNDIYAPRRDGIRLVGSPIETVRIAGNRVFGATNGLPVRLSDDPKDVVQADNVTLDLMRYAGDRIPAGGGASAPPGP